MHWRPVSSTDHFELSTMIGRRATSGSVATTFRNVRIARSDSSRSASMFTSRTFAPPRTCSSATSTAPVKSPPSTRRRNRAEPVTFVRSPAITNPVSGPISNVSSPLQRVRRPLTCDTVSQALGARPPTASPIEIGEHTSELQSRQYLVCRLLLEKKKKQTTKLMCKYKKKAHHIHN